MVVTNRLFKQAVYASIFGFFVVLVLSSAIISLIQVTPTKKPTPTPTTIVQPIIMQKADIVVHEHTADAVAQLRNPNPQAGVAQLPVQFIFQNDQGETIAEKSVMTYILPGSLQYVVALQVPTMRPVSQVKVNLPTQVQFQSLPNNLDLPVFGSFTREKGLQTIGGEAVEVQKGIVSNNSTFDYARVEVVVVALNDRNEVVGIGQTFAGELKVGERREFTVSWPQPLSPSQRIIIAPSTNSFKSENILQVIGDPSQLR